MDHSAASRRIPAVLTVLAVLMAMAGTLLATPAGAEVVEGTCEGTVTIGDDVVIDATRPAGDPVEVPRSGSFAFNGTVHRTPGDEPTVQEGQLRLLLPLGSRTIDSWSGTSATDEVTGTGTYEIPTIVPDGSGPLPLELVLTDDDERCVVLVGVTAPGSTFDATTLILLLLTLLLLAALVVSGRRNAKGDGHPLVGLLAGLLAGISGAGALFGGGAIALNSLLWWGLPVLLGAAGLLLGAVAPIGRTPTSEPDPEAEAMTGTPSGPQSAPGEPSDPAADTADPPDPSEPDERH